MTTLSVTAALAAYKANIKLSPISISDSANNISTNIDALFNLFIHNKIIDITQTDNLAHLTITATQLKNDAGVLTKISNPYSLNITNVPIAKVSSILSNTNILSISVSDSASNIKNSANLTSLINIGAKLTRITETGNISPITLTVQQYGTSIANKFTNFAAVVSDAPVTLLPTLLTDNKISNLSIKDSSSIINNNLDTFNTLGSKLTAISFNGSLNTLNISLTQLINTAAVLAKIKSPYHLTINNAPTSYLSNLIANNHVSSILLTDSANNINTATNLSSLLKLGNKLTSITETGTISPIVLNAAQYNSSFTNKFINFTASINNATTALINALSKDPHVSSVNIIDTAKNIANNLDKLQALGSKLTAISFTGISNGLAIKASQLTNDASTLSKVTGSYSLTVSSVSATDIETVLSNPQVTSISITDTATNVANHLNNLQDNVSFITKIILSDSPATLTITETQLNNDASTLALITSTGSITINNLTLTTNTYTLKITDVLAADVTTVLANHLVSSISITDDSNEISTQLDALQANYPHITAITLADAPTSLAINPTQLTTDANILNLISASSPTILFNVDLGSSGSISNLDTANGNINLIFNSNTTGTPTDTNFESINHFSTHDEISFSTGLTVVNNSAGAAPGIAVIDTITGIATFDTSDISLQQEIIAVENAITFNSTSPDAGNVALWSNGSDSYAFITDAISGVSAGDDLIKFIGTNVSHLSVVNQAIIYI